TQWNDGPFDGRRVHFGREVHRRRGLARSNSIHPDPVTSQLQRHHARELPYTRLRAAIRRTALENLPVENAADIDDPSTDALRNHVSRRYLRANEGPCQIHSNDVPPFLQRDFEESSAVIDSCVIDEGIHSTQLPDQTLDRGTRIQRIGQVLRGDGRTHTEL